MDEFTAKMEEAKPWESVEAYLAFCHANGFPEVTAEDWRQWNEGIGVSDPQERQRLLEIVFRHAFVKVSAQRSYLADPWAVQMEAEYPGWGPRAAILKADADRRYPKLPERMRKTMAGGWLYKEMPKQPKKPMTNEDLLGIGVGYILAKAFFSR